MALNGICLLTGKPCDDGECYHGCIKMVPQHPECMTPQYATPPELKAVLADALSKQNPK